MRHSLGKIVRGFAFYFAFGFLVFVWRVAPALLGWEGAYAEDMVTPAIPTLVVFVIAWVSLFPFVMLLGVSVEVVVELLGISREETDLR